MKCVLCGISYFNYCILVCENIENYMKEREEALDSTLWKTRFGKDYGHVVRQIAE
jgi:hypothetical protein